MEMKGTCVSFANALKTHEWFQKHRNVDFCVWSASCGNTSRLAALTGFDGVIGVSGFDCAAFLWILWFPTTTEEVGVCVSDGVCVFNDALAKGPGCPCLSRSRWEELQIS